MKILIVLALVALCQALPQENRVSTRLSTPTIISSTIRDENFLLFEIEWTRVVSGIWTDPVIGYKVRVWEVPNARLANAEEYTMPDGKYTVLVEEGQEEEESFDGTKNSSNILLEEIRTPADLQRAAFFNVRPGVTFEVRVSAYTQTTQTPYSSMYRISFNANRPTNSGNSVRYMSKKNLVQ